MATASDFDCEFDIPPVDFHRLNSSDTGSEADAWFDKLGDDHSVLSADGRESEVEMPRGGNENNDSFDSKPVEVNPLPPRGHNLVKSLDAWNAGFRGKTVVYAQPTMLRGSNLAVGSTFASAPLSTSQKAEAKAPLPVDVLPSKRNPFAKLTDQSNAHGRNVVNPETAKGEANNTSEVAEDKENDDVTISSVASRVRRLPLKPSNRRLSAAKKLKNAKTLIEKNAARRSSGGRRSFGHSRRVAPVIARPVHRPNLPAITGSPAAKRVKKPAAATASSAQPNKEYLFQPVAQTSLNFLGSIPPFNVEPPTPINNTQNQTTSIRTGSKNTLSAKRSHKTMAEEIMCFTRKTPDRFHSKPRNFKPAKRSFVERELIRAVAPNLTTVTRNRNRTCISQKEKETQIVAQMKQHKFQANPIPVGLLIRDAPDTTTESAAPSFRTKRLLSSITEGVEPKVSRKNRLGSDSSVASSTASRPLSRTDPEPFSFQARDERARMLKQKKIDEQLERERKMAIFVAQPMPLLPCVIGLPERHPKPVTKPEPFQLVADQRGEIYQRTFQRKIDEEQQQMAQAAIFKAKPCDVLHKEPFVPQPEYKELSEPEPFNLHTEKRAAEREEFDTYVQNCQAEAQADKARRQREREERDAAEVARIRAEAVHRAGPVKKYTNIVIQPSDKELTECESPFLSRRMKATGGSDLA